MPAGPSRQWKARKEPLTDHFIQASVVRGMNQANGWFAELVVNELSGMEEALEIKRSLHRCARFLGFSMNAQIERTATGDYQVRFKAINKAHARAYMPKKYGDNPDNWPYNPYRKRPPKEPA